MSYQETERVWEREFSRPQQLVMLALAEKTPKGGKTFPGVATVAWMTGYSSRQVQRIMATLEEIRAIVKVAEARHHTPAIYQLHPEVAPLKPQLDRSDIVPALDEDRDDMMVSPLDDDRGDISVPTGVTSGTMRDDISDDRGDTIMSRRGDITASPKQEETRARTQRKNERWKDRATDSLVGRGQDDEGSEDREPSPAQKGTIQRGVPESSMDLLPNQLSAREPVAESTEQEGDFVSAGVRDEDTSTGKETPLERMRKLRAEAAEQRASSPVKLADPSEDIVSDKIDAAARKAYAEECLAELTEREEVL